jgi:hypothetical protein
MLPVSLLPALQMACYYPSLLPAFSLQLAQLAPVINILSNLESFLQAGHLNHTLEPLPLYYVRIQKRLVTS